MSESQSLPTLTPSIHAVFLLHGLWGWPEHMHALRDALHNQAEKQDASVDIYCCRSYEGTKTYDGVDVCADRVVAEIRQHIIEIQQSSHNVEKLSILGSVHLCLASSARLTHGQIFSWRADSASNGAQTQAGVVL